MKYKILAVDDNPINLKLLTRTLINSNYQISTADTGKKALKLAKEVKPDLILLDVILPDLDGYEVCKQLQENEKTKSIPVIFLSAKNESVDKARGLALGAVDYLTKPFDALEINARVRTHLSIRKSNIKLLHEKQGLQNRLQEISERYKKVDGNHTVSLFIDKHSQTDFHIITKQYELFSKALYTARPPVIKLLPIPKDKTHLFFLLLNGFEKNYSTVIVHQLVENYIAGFLDSLHGAEVNEKNLLRLIKDVMDKFSPDIYDVAFTFALGHIHLEQNKFNFYSLQEEVPFIISENGNPVPGVERVSDSHSYFDDLLQAFTIELENKDKICLYRREGQLENKIIYETIFTESFEREKQNLKKSLNRVNQNLEKTDQDQLIACLALK